MLQLKGLTFMGLIFLLKLWNDEKNCSFHTVWTLIGFHHHVSFHYQFFHSIYIGEHFLDCYSSDSKLMMSFVRKSCACWISDLKWKWHQMTWKIQIHQQTFKYIFIYENKTNIETKIFLFQHFQQNKQSVAILNNFQHSLTGSLRFIFTAQKVYQSRPIARKKANKIWTNPLTEFRVHLHFSATLASLKKSGFASSLQATFESCSIMQLISELLKLSDAMFEQLKNGEFKWKLWKIIICFIEISHFFI